MPAVVVSGRGEARLRAGHLWVYRSDVRDVDAAGGDTVVVRNAAGKVLGSALYSDRSEIAVRLVTRGDAPADAALWRRRLEAAIAFRRTLDVDATAVRLVHAEGDLTPSLVVDRYDDVLVVQSLSQGTERLLPAIVATLVDLVRPRGILARNDVRARALEGLDAESRVLHGEVPPLVAIREGPVTLEVDPWHGQKTGLFLDQRENREAAARYARGRVLDCFSYSGGFALRLAPLADSVLAVESSDEAVSRISANAARNRLSNVEARVANAFDFLRAAERQGERFDTIVLDPPGFARTKAAVPRALPGYKEINLRALRILAPGGTLVTCSCSYHVDPATFAAVVHDASLDARAPVALVEERTQARDHPVLLGVPETRYLKCLILRRLPGA